MEEVVKEKEEKQPTEPQKQNYVKLPKWIAIISALILMVILVSGIFLLGIILGKAHNSTVTIITNTTPTSSPTSSVTPTKTVPNFPTSANPNLIRFTSEKLGITFTYLKSQNGQTISTQEIGNKVYIFFDNTAPTNGQYLEVFSKDKNQSLADAIKAQILKGYALTDCQLKPETQYVPKGFEALAIVVPINPNDDQATIEAKVSKCPQGYTAMGGMAYFIEDPSHPDRMIFLSIGQYLINSEGDNIGWQSTIQLF